MNSENVYYSAVSPDPNGNRVHLQERKKAAAKVTPGMKRLLFAAGGILAFLIILILILLFYTMGKVGSLEKDINALHRSIIVLQGNKNCDDVLRTAPNVRNMTGGIYYIYPPAMGSRKLEVYCDSKTDGGGWLVFQRRMDGSVNFFRDWDDYVSGFGEKGKEFWLGLETIRKLTAARRYELRVDLEDWKGNRTFARYSSFHIGDSSAKYRLHLGDYSGDAGDSLTTTHNGMYFSTKDRDSDADRRRSCATEFKGGWWYGGCHTSNLNGIYLKGGKYFSSYADGIDWYNWKGHNYSMKSTEMKMRLL